MAPLQELAACRLCGAPIYRLRDVASGRLTAVDWLPTPAGGWLIDRAAGTCRLVPPAERTQGRLIYLVNHANTCPAWHAQSGQPPHAHQPALAVAPVAPVAPAPMSLDALIASARADVVVRLLLDRGWTLHSVALADAPTAPTARGGHA